MLIIFLLLAIMLLLVSKLSRWCYRVSDLLRHNTSKETKEYLDAAIKEERVRKEKIKREVLSSKYLSNEFLVSDGPSGSGSVEIRNSIEQLIKGTEGE